MTKNEMWAWLAGFLEGEGSFQIVIERPKGFDRCHGQVVASNCDKALLQRCVEIAGGSIFGPFNKKRTENSRPAYRWNISGKKLDIVLPKLMPFLISKRQQAQILLTLRKETFIGARTGEYGRKAMEESIRARRRKMKLAVNALNLRGMAVPTDEQLKALEEFASPLQKARTAQCGLEM